SAGARATRPELRYCAGTRLRIRIRASSWSGKFPKYGAVGVLRLGNLDHAAGIADHGGVVRNVLDHDGSRADGGPLADPDARHHGGVRSHEGPVSDLDATGEAAAVGDEDRIADVRLVADERADVNGRVVAQAHVRL